MICTALLLSCADSRKDRRCLICLLSLCRWFQGPTTASAAEGFAIISVALTLLGFWVVEYRTDVEFLQAYMFCGRNQMLWNEPPYLVNKGIYFDGTPCVDVDTVRHLHLASYALLCRAWPYHGKAPEVH